MHAPFPKLAWFQIFVTFRHGVIEVAEFKSEARCSLRVVLYVKRVEYNHHARSGGMHLWRELMRE